MAWIKRNLVVVISAVIAIALLGCGGWYLYSALEKNASVDAEIGTTKAELERLLQEKPFPSSSNITQARRELEKANAFAASARKLFPSTKGPSTELNNLSFKVLLQNNVDELNKEAASVGVKVDLTSVPAGFSNYYYSFEAQRLPVNFPPQSLHPLAERLQDIREIVSILFKAKINRLEYVRRAAVNDEVGSGPDYLPEGPRVHEGGVVMWPYEVGFQAFSPEIAAVMEQLGKAPQAWVVRSVVVEPAEPVLKTPERTAQSVTNRAGRVTTAAAPPETVLNERTLRVILKLDVIKSMR